MKEAFSKLISRLTGKASLNVPYREQKNLYYCGPAALQMVFEYFKYPIGQKILAKESETDRERGTSNKKLARVATDHGFSVYTSSGSDFEEIRRFLRAGQPVIVNFINPSDGDGHFAVVSGITRSEIILNDPYNGKDFRLSHEEFLSRWKSGDNRYKEWMMAVGRDENSSTI